MEQLSRANQEAMQVQIARLKDELSASRVLSAEPGKTPEKSKFVLSWGLVLTLIVGLFIVMGVVFYVIRARDLDKQNQLLQEQKTATTDQQQLADLKTKEAELELQLARRATTGTSSPVNPNSAKPKPTGPPSTNKSTSNANGPSSTTASAGRAISAGQATCQIVPLSGGYTVPGSLMIALDNSSVGSITIGTDGSSTGLPFKCIAGGHSLQMQLANGPVCTASAMVFAGTNEFRAFYTSDGKNAKCSLERVEAAAK